METLNSPLVPVSWGELLDKLAILEIKLDRMKRPDQHANVEREHRLLQQAAAPAMATEGVDQLFQLLRRTNTVLWDIEDALRRQEADARFGAEFVALARSVYRTNDQRAAVKRHINRILASDLIEEKSYAHGHEQEDEDPPVSLGPAH